jgi:5-methylcytosine-specific restriction endonuclease McrA
MNNPLPYEKVLQDYGNHKFIPYAELLNCIEWRERRRAIILRDGEKCQICNCFGTETLFTGSKLIHFYEDFEEVEEFDDEGRFRVRIRMVKNKVNRPVYLHVHHKYYVLSRLPWEYEDDALETMCSVCHADFHSKNNVPKKRYENDAFFNLQLTPCPRCYGAGHFPEYSHVQNGVCFYCSGSMYLELMK